MAGWFIMENPIEMDDLEVRYPHFRKPPYVICHGNFTGASKNGHITSYNQGNLRKRIILESHEDLSM